MKQGDVSESAAAEPTGSTNPLRMLLLGILSVLLQGTANAGDLDGYDHCKYRSAIVPPGESE